MSKHYLFGGSNAAVWSKCNGAPYLAALCANETNEAMERGTRIHHLAECMIKNVEFPANQFADELEVARKYADQVINLFPDAQVEVHCTVSELVGGTIDGLVVRGQELFLWDLKTGHRPVYATFNQQLMAYLWFYCGSEDIPEIVHLGIWHEIEGTFDWWDITREEIIEAFNLFEVVTSTERSLTKGDHCGKCRAIARCPLGSEFPQEAIVKSDEQVAEDFRKIELYKNAISKTETEAEYLAKHDRLPGFTLRPGKRKPMKWLNVPPKEIAGVTVYKEEPMTPTQVAKIVGEEYLIQHSLAARPTQDLIVVPV